MCVEENKNKVVFFNTDVYIVTRWYCSERTIVSQLSRISQRVKIAMFSILY